ncbi:MAG TPA: hypothetical protein VNT31_13275 [Nocardioides sp.]|nr:hypothetical protein [Nocardioides sp.]
MIAELLPALVPGLLVMAGDDAPLWLLAAGPAGAVGTYWLIYRYYRNTDKSHEFERDTIIEAQPVQGGEEKVGHISKTRDSNIDGDNSNQHRRRVQRVR